MITFGKAEGPCGFLGSFPSLEDRLLFFIDLKLVLLQHALFFSLEAFQQLLFLRS